MSDRRIEERRQDERRKELVSVDVERRADERRVEERRSGDQSRRQIMERRQQSQPVETDRRKGLRRIAEAEAAAVGEEAVPDWMEQTLAEAAQRQEQNPAMSPPPVNVRENHYFNRSEDEIKRQERIWDAFIMGFIIICFIVLVAILVYGV